MCAGRGRPVEFGEVLRRRKMVRTYTSDRVDPDVLDRILDRARRAPSAGFSQGVSFLVLSGPEETARFWEAARDPEEAEWPGPGMLAAPVLVMPMAAKDVYLDRYAEEDKGWADRDEG